MMTMMKSGIITIYADRLNYLKTISKKIIKLNPKLTLEIEVNKFPRENL